MEVACRSISMKVACRGHFVGEDEETLSLLFRLPNGGEDEEAFSVLFPADEPSSGKRTLNASS
jgi:hypothetical protein